MNCTTQIFRLSHCHKDPQAVQWNVASLPCFHGGVICRGKRPPGSFQGHLWCSFDGTSRFIHLAHRHPGCLDFLGCKRCDFHSLLDSKASTNITFFFPLENERISPWKLMVVWKMKCPFYKWSLKIGGHACSFSGGVAVCEMYQTCVYGLELLGELSEIRTCPESPVQQQRADLFEWCRLPQGDDWKETVKTSWKDSWKTAGLRSCCVNFESELILWTDIFDKVML